MRLSELKKQIAAVPARTTKLLYSGSDETEVYNRLFGYVWDAPLLDDHLTDPYPLIEVLLRSALHDDWREYSALGRLGREVALESVGWKLRFAEEEFRAREHVSYCSSPGLAWAVIGVCTDEFSCDLPGARYCGAHLLRHLVHGEATDTEFLGALRELGELLTLTCRPAAWIPSLMLLWFATQDPGERVGLERLIDYRRKMGLDGPEGLSDYSDPTLIERDFDRYLEVIAAPDDRMALVSRLSQAWQFYLSID